MSKRIVGVKELIDLSRAANNLFQGLGQQVFETNQQFYNQVSPYYQNYLNRTTDFANFIANNITDYVTDAARLAQQSARQAQGAAGQIRDVANYMVNPGLRQEALTESVVGYLPGLVGNIASVGDVGFAQALQQVGLANRLAEGLQTQGQNITNLINRINVTQMPQTLDYVALARQLRPAVAASIYQGLGLTPQEIANLENVRATGSLQAYENALSQAIATGLGRQQAQTEQLRAQSLADLATATGSASDVYNKAKTDIDYLVANAVADARRGYTQALNRAVVEGARYGLSPEAVVANLAPLAYSQASDVAAAANQARQQAIQQQRELAQARLTGRLGLAENLENIRNIQFTRGLQSSQLPLTVGELVAKSAAVGSDISKSLASLYGQYGQLANIASTVAARPSETLGRVADIYGKGVSSVVTAPSAYTPLFQSATSLGGLYNQAANVYNQAGGVINQTGGLYNQLANNYGIAGNLLGEGAQNAILPWQQYMRGTALGIDTTAKGTEFYQRGLSNVANIFGNLAAVRRQANAGGGGDAGLGNIIGGVGSAVGAIIGALALL